MSKIKYPSLADYAANPSPKRKTIRHRSKSYAKPYGKDGWKFYDPYGDIVWQGSLAQLSNIYDIADSDIGDSAAFYLVEEAQKEDSKVRSNPCGSRTDHRDNPRQKYQSITPQELLELKPGDRIEVKIPTGHKLQGVVDHFPTFDEVAFIDDRDGHFIVNVWQIEKVLSKKRSNPGRRTARPPGVSQAVKTFEDFNEYPSKGASKFAREIIIPERMPCPGPCRWVTYRSDKWNDGTHDYIHTITSYPRVKCAMAGENYPTVKVPAKVRNATTLTQIGLRALGFAFEYDDDEYEAKVPAGTEWFWSQTARALYLIQNKRKLVAVIWGGKLNGEPRGIVG
jgi:hypothetical protein